MKFISMLLTIFVLLSCNFYQPAQASSHPHPAMVYFEDDDYICEDCGSIFDEIEYEQYHGRCPYCGAMLLLNYDE